MKMLRTVLIILVSVIIAFPAVSQVSVNNDNSVRPIPKYEQLYRKRVWRRMDLNEKQNKPFFAYNNEITKILIQEVKKGTLQPYVNDSLITKMTMEKFLEQIKQAGFEEEEDDGFGDEFGDDGFGDDGFGDDGFGDDGFGDDGFGEDPFGGGGDEEEEEVISDEFLPSQITLLEIMEDIIFDKRRSLVYYDIQSIKMIIQASEFETGVSREVAVFKWKDLSKVFRNLPGEAIWFNRQNSAEHRNLADAFDLRLFSSRLVKVDNPRNDYIVDIYNRSLKEGLLASYWLEMQLMEKEHNVWEY